MPTPVVETNPYKYCESLTEYHRRKTVQVRIGDLMLGSDYPIRVQSMTTIDTMDTMGSVAQSIRMIEAGCELVRITAPSLKEAENLAEIKKELRKRGYNTPLVADIHFTPNAAEVAARIVEKVRINPGNYADRKRFEVIDYTEVQYQAELERIREKFLPLLRICKEYGTALRIGTNHGSLSDRIMSRYGDNPLGMVESALDFLRICEDEHFYNIVISMKSSNPQVMVQAYRLLVHRLDTDGFKPYPLHLGVTEAGDGEDGRIKSALGIGTLLEDGLGDTVRVSLTEEPEFEIPVAEKLIARYSPGGGITPLSFGEGLGRRLPENGVLLNPFQYQRRKTHEVLNIGKENVPRVVADLSHLSKIEMADFKAFGYTYLPLPDKWGSNDTAADFVYLGDKPVPFMMPNGLKAIQNYETWLQEPQKSYPLITFDSKTEGGEGFQFSEELNFILLKENELLRSYRHILLGKQKNCVIVLETEQENALQSLRSFLLEVLEIELTNPVIIKRTYPQDLDAETLQLYAATDCGGLLIDGFGDGIWLKSSLTLNGGILNPPPLGIGGLNQLAFGVLQAARTRITKTEYISCPSCGRTLFDLQETTAMIRKRTEHLKGVKIGIMGCIVNGPGEMADADYGYVGSGKGKITLYKGQEVVKKSVPTEKAVDELIKLIQEDGRWIDAP